MTRASARLPSSRHLARCLTLAVLAGCGQQESRNLPDADRPDADTPSDADEDDGAQHDAEADVDEDRDSVRCGLGSPAVTIAEDDAPFLVSTLHALPVEHLVVVGATTRPDRNHVVVRILRSVDLGLVRDTDLEPVSMVAGYDMMHDEIIALERTADQVSFSRLSIDMDWSVIVDGTRRLCAGCRASASPPIFGPSLAVAAVSDPARTEVQAYVVPNDESSPIQPSGALSGTAPAIVEGTFGPVLLLHREGAMYAARLHWNGDLVEEVEVVTPGEVLPEYGAASDRGREVFLAAVRLGAVAVIIDVYVLGESLEVERWGTAAEDLQSIGRPGIGLGDRTAAVVWMRSLPDGRSVPEAIIVDRDALAPVLARTELDPPCRRAPTDGPGVVVTATQRGYAIIWNGCADAPPLQLRGVLVECTPDG